MAGKTSLTHKIAAVAMLAGGALLLAFTLTSEEAAKRDYVCYWAAARLVAQHQNPYGFDEVLRMERSAGWPSSEPLMGRMTPFSLPLLLPLACMEPRWGAVLWSMAIVGALTLSIHAIRRLHGDPPGRLHLVGYFFAPALACILAGQAAAFVLLGVIGFLRLSDRPFLAGMSLAICAVKPQLFLPFAAAFLVWVFAGRRYRYLWGVLVGLGVLGMAATLLDAQVWRQYFAMLGSDQLEEKLLPTFSLFFRLAIDRRAVWLQSVPVVVASCWALWYGWRHRENWDWMNRGGLVLLWSLFVAPYAWFTDEVVLLPVVLHSIYLAQGRLQKMAWLLVPGGVAVLFVLLRVPLNSIGYVWTPAAWLIGCTRQKRY